MIDNWEQRERTRPTYPLWIRDVPPDDRPGWERLTGIRSDGLPDGTHTGGVWVLPGGMEAWKPLDARPYVNADCHCATNEAVCLEALAGRPGFPENWHIEERSYEREGETVVRKWLVRPRCYVLGKEWDKEHINLDQVLAVEQAVRGMNQTGWEINDAVSVGLGLDYEPFILDLSVAAYSSVRDHWYAPNDYDRVIRWFEWLGLDRLVALRKDGRNVLPRHIIEMDRALKAGWPGKEWQHVYASRSRPVSLTWASKLRGPCAHLIQDDCYVTGVHTWAVTPEPLSEDVLYDYELTWAWGPLVYDEEPALPVYWWMEE